MKSTIDSLTAKEREALADGYNSAFYKALQRFCELEVQGLGHDAIQAPNMEVLKYISGRASMAKDIILLIRKLHEQAHKSHDVEGS